MPLYQIQHSSPLSPDQQDKLAVTITEIHAEKFTTPSLFVNVTFTDTSSQRAYVAGKRVCPPFSFSLSPCLWCGTNTPNPKSTGDRILAHVRHGPSRTQEDYNDLCSSIQAAWFNLIVEPRKDTSRDWIPTIFILGDIVAGQELGMAIPPAGQDREWLKGNVPVFRRRAREEGEPFVGLMRELEERGDWNEIL